MLVLGLDRLLRPRGTQRLFFIRVPCFHLITLTTLHPSSSAMRSRLMCAAWRIAMRAAGPGGDTARRASSRSVGICTFPFIICV